MWYILIQYITLINLYYVTDSSSDGLNLTFLTTQYDTNHSEIQETTIVNYLSHVLAILCNKEKLTLLETDTISPLCYTIENIQDTIMCPSNCDNNTWWLIYKPIIINL